MKKSIIKFLNKEFRGINEAALLLGGFAFFSQILGLIRDRILAHSVGAGPVLDIYYAAFRIPDFLYISIASLASVTVLLPFLVDKINGDGEQNHNNARSFLNNVFSAYMVFMLVASILLFIAMPFIAKYIVPGFTSEQLTLLIKISRIMLLSPIFIGLSNLIGTVTQLFRNFFVFSLSPIFYNIGILFGIIYLYPIIGLYGLALGVVIGALVHFLIQVPVVFSHNFFPKFVIKINWTEIFQIVKMSLPRTIALSSNSLAFIVLIALASTLKEGSISLFTFSYNLQSVPVGIIGISYSVAAFPILVQSYSMKDMGNFIGHIIGAAKQIIFWSLPVITLLIVLRAQIVRVVLGSETFSWSDTRLTAAAVALFVLSLVSQGLVLLFVRGYYASGNTRKPLIINVLSSVMVVVLAIIIINLFKNFPILLNHLELILRVRAVPGTIMLALPLAYALGSMLNFSLIWISFKKDFLLGGHSGLFRTFIESLLAALVMGLVSYILLGIFNQIFNLETGLGIFLQGLCSGVLGIFFGIITLTILKNKEFISIKKAFHNKFWQNRVVAPEQTDL